MSLILTGASGYIGNHFKNFSKFKNILEVDLLINELKDYLFCGFDTLLHLAALVHQKGRVQEDNYYKINTDLAYKTAIYAKESGVKHFILLSTVKVYGEETSTFKSLNEFSTCNPVEPYGKSKLDAEVKIRCLEDENFIFSAIRSPIVYGPNVKGNILSLLQMIDNFPVIPLGNINNNRSMVSARNLITYIDAVIDCKKSGVFIPLDSYSVSTSELVNAIISGYKNNKTVLSMPPLLRKIIKRIRPGLYKRLFGNLLFENNFTRYELNINELQPFPEAVLEMAQWYFENRTR